MILQVGDGAVGPDGSSADSGVVGEDGRKLGAGNRDAQYLASAAAVHQAKETPAPFPQEKGEGEEGPNRQQESAGRREQNCRFSDAFFALMHAYNFSLT